MKTIISSKAVRLLLGAALVLGSASMSVGARPAFAAEGGHTGGMDGHSGGVGGSGGGHETGGHESGESCGGSGGCSGSGGHETGGHESGESCGGSGGCSGEDHEETDAGHSGGKNGSGGKGSRGGAGDYARGSAAGGIVGRIFEQGIPSADKPKSPAAGTETAGSQN